LLEDILEFSEGRFHLFQGELVLSFGRLVLGNPSVQFCDGVIQESPFFEEGINLSNKGVRVGFDLAVSGLKGCNFSICFNMGGHLLSSSFSSFKNLKIVHAGLVKSADLLMKCLDFIKVARLGKSIIAVSLRLNQPWGEFLETSSVLSPVFDILREAITLLLGTGLEVSNILGNSVELILVVLGILRDIFSLG